MSPAEIFIPPIALFAWLLQAADPLPGGPLSSPPTLSTPAAGSPSSSPSSIDIYSDRGARLGYATVHPDGSVDIYRADSSRHGVVQQRAHIHHPTPMIRGYDDTQSQPND